MDELLALQFEPRGLVQNTLRVESRDVQHILTETSKALAHLQERYSILEENQKVLEENQKMLLLENQRLKEQLEKVSATPPSPPPSLAERLLQLFELSAQDVEATAGTETSRRLALLHRSPAFLFLIKRFNNMVDNFNLLNSKVGLVEGQVQALADGRPADPPPLPMPPPPSADRAAVPRRPSEAPEAYRVQDGAANDESESSRRLLATAAADPSARLHAEDPAPPGGEDAPERRTVRRPFLGVEITEVADAEGLRVISIRPDSPAIKAGLQVGDCILTFDDAEVTTRDAFRAMVRTATPGHVLPVIFTRTAAGKTIRMKTNIVVGAIESEPERPPPPPEDRGRSPYVADDRPRPGPPHRALY
eukprot:EG_transcript_10859